MSCYVYRSFDDLVNFHPSLFLPEKICRSFFIHLLAENKSPRTIYGYASDISLFLKYLSIDSFTKDTFTAVNQYTYANLDTVPADTISQYRNYVHVESIDHQKKLHGVRTYSQVAKIDPTANIKELEYVKSTARLDKGLQSKPATSNRKMTSLRRYVTFLVSNKFISNNFMLNVHSEKNDEHKQVVYLKKNEITSLLGTVETMQTRDYVSAQQKGHLKRSECRDYAILILFVSTGLRVSELAAIDLTDINFRDNEVKVIRKGNEERWVPFSNDVKDALEAYIELERSYYDVSKGEPALFLSNRGSRITTRSIERLVTKMAQHAEIAKHVTPHTLRKTFGANYYQATHDIKETSELLNHKNVSLTAKVYSACDIEEVFDRAKNIDFVKVPERARYDD